MAGVKVFAPDIAEQGVVVNKTEIQDLVFHQIDGARIGVGKLPGLEQNGIQQGVQVFNMVQFLQDAQQPAASIGSVNNVHGGDSFLESAGFSGLDQLLRRAYHKNREIASGWKHRGNIARR
jgi:hypothetical protein